MREILIILLWLLPMKYVKANVPQLREKYNWKVISMMLMHLLIYWWIKKTIDVNSKRVYIFRFLKQVEENVSLPVDFPLERGHYKNDSPNFLEEAVSWLHDYLMIGTKTGTLETSNKFTWLSLMKQRVLDLITLSAVNHTFYLPNYRIFIYSWF